MPQSFAPAVSLRDFVRVLFRHKVKCIAFFAIVMSVTLAYVVFAAKVYRSEAKLFVRLGRENVTVDPTATASGDPLAVVPTSRETEINSVLEILQSRVLLEAVVDRLGPEVVLENEPLTALEPLPPAARPAKAGEAAQSGSAATGQSFDRRGGAPITSRDMAIDTLVRRADIAAVKKSNVISVLYEGHSPAVAQAVVSCLVDACQDQHIRANRAPGSHQFLVQQTHDLQEKLNRLEDEMREVKTATGVSSLAEQRLMLAHQLDHLQEETLTTATALASAEATLKEMRRGLSTVPEHEVTGRTTGFPNTAADAMRSQLYGLQLKEQELSAKYTDLHPEVLSLRRQRVEAEVIVGKEEAARVQETTGPNHVRETAASALLSQEPVVAALRAKAEVLKTQLVEAHAVLDRFNQHEVQISRLQREVELAEAKYRKYSASLEQARLDQALETERISNLSVVESATYEAQPIRPRRLMTLILGLCIGLFGALGLAVLCELLDHSVRSADDLERRLDLAALASIPQGRPQVPWAVHSRSRS